MTTWYTEIESPVGPITIVSDGSAITTLTMRPSVEVARKGWIEDDSRLKDTRDQLAAYFAGTLREFDLPLAARGSAFQKRVWDALVKIPFGETTSYGALAAAVGVPGSARAVGAANRTNPIGIIVPCHRVIGADGTLTGYAGGMERKRFLLDHEASVAGRPGQMELRIT